MGVLTAAQEFQKLLDYKYEFIVIKNRNSEPLKLTLTFSKSDFSHLCGLQHLKNLTHFKNKSAEFVFDEIINGNSQYSDSIFERSAYYSEIEDRVQLLENLETLLDNRDNVNRSHRIFKFNRNANNNSRIEASFFIKDESDSLKNYFLIDKNSSGQYYGRSCFARTPNQREYADGHTAYTMLYKGKINLRTNEREDLFLAPSYRAEFEAQRSAGNIMQMQFDTPVSDNTLTVTASDSFKEILTNIAEQFRTSFQEIMNSITSAVRQVFSRPQNTDITLSEEKTESDKQETEHEFKTAPAPEEDDEFIIKNVYSMFAVDIGMQGYENYAMIVSADKLDFQIPITYETEQKNQEQEHDFLSEKAVPTKFEKKQVENDDR